jgi:hypothetical protein
LPARDGRRLLARFLGGVALNLPISKFSETLNIWGSLQPIIIGTPPGLEEIVPSYLMTCREELQGMILFLPLPTSGASPSWDTT